MNKEEMMKTYWKPYMTIHYEPGHGSKLCHEMTLIGIEFDDECVHCVPLEQELYEHEEFYINIQFIKIPKNNKSTLRIITQKPPKVNTRRAQADRTQWLKYTNNPKSQ